MDYPSAGHVALDLLELSEAPACLVRPDHHLVAHGDRVCRFQIFEAQLADDAALLHTPVFQQHLVPTASGFNNNSFIQICKTLDGRL